MVLNFLFYDEGKTLEKLLSDSVFYGYQ